MSGWRVKYEMATGDTHVVPHSDLRAHTLTTDCWCRPVEDAEYAGVHVHSSADERESYEEGRKPS